MRVLIIQDSDWLKRNPAQQHHLAEMLSRRGHEVRVIDFEILWKAQGKREFRSKRQVFGNVSKIHADARVTVVRPGIIKIPLLDYASLAFSYKRECERQIREFSPDVIVGFGILGPYLAVRIAKKRAIPFLYYRIDIDHKLIPFKALQCIGKMLESKTLKQADRVLVINEKLKEYVVGIGASPKQVQVLRTGIDLKRFNPDTDGKDIRKQHGIIEKDIVLFFMGWLYHFSGLKEVALQLAKIDNPNLKLFVVGEGDAYEELQQIRDRYNLQDRVILTGKKPYHEIPGFVAAADICLLPAYPDEPIMQNIVPIKMYEYMAMRKPVLASPLPGIMTEFGEDNGVVYVDKPEDTITKAMELIQNNKVKELGERARSFAARYSWDNIADEFERILKETVAQKRLGNKHHA